jgi:hypothetical protein
MACSPSPAAVKVVVIGSPSRRALRTAERPSTTVCHATIGVSRSNAASVGGPNWSSAWGAERSSGALRSRTRVAKAAPGAAIAARVTSTRVGPCVSRPPQTTSTLPAAETRAVRLGKASGDGPR